MGRVEAKEESVGGEAAVPFPPVAQDGETAASFPPVEQGGGQHALPPGTPIIGSPLPPVEQGGGQHALPPGTPIIGSPWSTGLFDCHEDQTNAVMTAIFPCVTFGQIAEVLDAGELTCPMGSFIYLLMMPALCSQWLMGSKYRKKLRTRYGLVEAPYEDVVSHIFCSCCSLCQEYRELRNRGLNPALGYNGILAQQGLHYGYPQTRVPPAVQSMSN